ncbi:hypothetical protein [Gaiella occulta]|nr:hypothetical protein [Gaiella occulta]
MRRLVVAPLATAAILAATAGVAEAAAPRIVIFSGTPLAQQVAE